MYGITDSLEFWIQGLLANPTYATFTTSAWRLWRASIPFAAYGTMYERRLYLAGDPQAPNLVFFSDIVGGISMIGAFPQDNVFQLEANGDVITGFAKLYDWLVIFQRRHTWLLKGGILEGGRLELALSDEGCIAPNSITTIGNRVLYLSERGWRIFDGNSADDFAIGIKPAVQSVPRTQYRVNQRARDKAAAAFDPTTGNVWMSMAFDSSETNNGSFIYNFVDQSLTYTDEVYGRHIYTFSFLDTLRLLFDDPDTGSAFLYGYQPITSEIIGVDQDTMTAQWSTGWLDFGNPVSEKVVTEGMIHALVSAPIADTSSAFRKLYVKFYKDFDTTAFYVDTTNVFGKIIGTSYEFNLDLRLEVYQALKWIRVEFVGAGLHDMDIERLALRYRTGSDIIRDAVAGVRQ